MIFHPLCSSIAVPERFNDPFNYTPHPLCQEAAERLQQTLPPFSALEEQAIHATGKMFGILLVEHEGQIGWLQAYSGQDEWGLDKDAFVPAIVDYLQPDGYFKQHEAIITSLNQQISAALSAPQRASLLHQHDDLRQQMEQAIKAQQAIIRQAKERRDAVRSLGDLSAEQQQQFIQESQYLKAELRRIKKRFAAEIDPIAAKLSEHNRHIAAMKQQRKQRSDALQQWLFSQFVMLNARGEQMPLPEIFNRWNAAHLSPKAQKRYSGCPSGAGECCEPKLLQYAYLHHMRPLSMAMFWWGPSPKEEVRHHRHYYPACQLRCRPILSWMLQGLDVDTQESAPTPSMQTQDTIKVLYEDEALAVVTKPSGLLSVPGKSHLPSVESIMRSRWHFPPHPIMVHRLDRDTSGLLVIARTAEAYLRLQEQFAHHHIYKRYIALCQLADNETPNEAIGQTIPASEAAKHHLPSEGEISLPLLADVYDRPRQRVSHTEGKQAVTQYKILGYQDLPDGAQGVRLELTPLTGRTHQLRVHCAHPEGLGCPIWGDPLYGNGLSPWCQSHRTRLMLHAEALRFTHPMTGETLSFSCPAPF